MKIYTLFFLLFATSSAALAVDQATCSNARDSYIEITVRETRQCCNSSFTKAEAAEAADGAIVEANNFSSAQDLKDEIASTSRQVDRLQNSKGNNGMLAHFMLYECLYKARLRELRILR